MTKIQKKKMIKLFFMIFRHTYWKQREKNVLKDLYLLTSTKNLLLLRKMLFVGIGKLCCTSDKHFMIMNSHKKILAKIMS